MICQWSPRTRAWGTGVGENVLEIKQVMTTTGRPQVAIDWSQFDKLCEIQCSKESIGHFFGCSIRTVERAVKREKKMTFDDYFRQKRECGRMALRQKLFELGLQGKVPILIFVAKNWLGMSDRGDQAAFEGPLPWVD